MLPVWAEVILAWLALGTLLNVLGFGGKYLKLLSKIEEGNKYDEGYECAIYNVRMFCKTTGKFPSMDWMMSVKHKKLDTEEKLKASGIENKEEDLRSINNYYFR